MPRGLQPVVFAHVERFLRAADRLAWFVSIGCPPSVLALSPTLSHDIEALVPDANAEPGLPLPADKDSSCIDIYEFPELLRLVLSQDRLSELRRRRLRLATALERGCDASVVEILLQQTQCHGMSTEDRERSHTLLAAWKNSQPPIKYESGQISAWIDRLTSDQRVSVDIDRRRHDLLDALIQACERNDLESMDALLPAYSSSSTQAEDRHVWHSRLVRLAIDREHLRIVELLLRCDPRGRIVRMQELLAALSPSNAFPALADILTGEKPVYAGLWWDAAALEQAVDTDDERLLGFLLEHVAFSAAALGKAGNRCFDAGKTAFAARIYSAVAALQWSEADSSRGKGGSDSQAMTYREGERVSVQHAGGLHFWTGTIHRCWLDGTYDVRVSEHSKAPLEAQVPAAALRPLSASKLRGVRRSVVARIARATVDRAVGIATSRIRDRDSDSDFRAAIGDGDSIEDDSTDGSGCGSDCDCGCESGSSSSSSVGSDSDSDSDSDSACSGTDESDVPSSTLSASTALHGDPMYSVAAPDDGEHAISLDATTIVRLTSTGTSQDSGPHERNLAVTTPTAAIAVVGSIEAPEAPSPSFHVESESTLVESVTKQASVPSSATGSVAPAPCPAVVSCTVVWTSTTVDLAQLSDLKAGDLVEVRCRGSEPWIRGRITRGHFDTSAFDVALESGEYEENVAREYIKLVTSAAEEEAEASGASRAEDDDATDVNDSHEALVGQEDGTPVDLFAPPATAVNAATASSEPFKSQEVPLESARAVSVDADSCGDERSSSESPDAISCGPASTQEMLTIRDLFAQPLTDIDPVFHVDVANHDPERGRLDFRVGDTIEANFLGIGKFHPAKIVHVHATSEAYDVAYSEFDQTELRVLPVNVRPPRNSSKRFKSLLKGSSSSVVPLEAANARPLPGNLGKDAVDSSHDGDPLPQQGGKLDEARGPISFQPDPPSTPSVERPQSSSSRSSSRTSNSRQPLLKHETRRARGLPRRNNRPVVSPREVEEWRNVDIILNRKRRLLNAPTGSVESTKVPWGEEFASIQSLKRFATQHPDVLRDHIVSQMSELGIQPKSPTRNPPSPPRLPSQARMASARETLLMIKDLAFLLKQRLSPFFNDIVPVVLPAVFSSDRRFLCDTAYDVLEALVLHCSGRRLACVLLQQCAHFNSQDDSRLLNLTSVYVEKCFANFSTPEIGALATNEPSKASTAIAQLLARLLCSKSIPARIAIEKSLLHIQHELGERRFELFLRVHLDSASADKVLLSDKVAKARGAVPNAPSLTLRSPRRQQRSGESPAAESSAACPSPSILQRMLQQRRGRVRPSP